MEQALYGRDGFYSSGGGAGRRRDFLTSPEVGPLFGAVLARAIDTWWTELGRPDPFTVVEAGAGPGTLAQAVLLAKPAVSPALHYVLVDVSPAMQRAQLDRLALASVANLAERGAADGPIVSALMTLPEVPPSDAGIVLCNELLDNLPFDVTERTADGWDEVRVATNGDGTFREVRVAASPALLGRLPQDAGNVAPGGRVPLQGAAQDWLADALALFRRGRVVAIDYAAATSAELAARSGGWLRTYRGHERGGHPLERPGSQDITADVAVDQLARIRVPDQVSSQADFLQVHGIEALVEEGLRWWREGAARPDLHAITGRSRSTEAAALLDPGGLGGFSVIEWVVR